jgi:hypothetical protein
VSSSPLVDLLSQRPPEELQRLRATMTGELEKLGDARRRLEMELAQVEEALGRQSRRRTAKPRRRANAVRPPASVGPTTRERVAALLSDRGEAMAPSAIQLELRGEGFQGSNSAIYNALTKLMKDEAVEKVGDGLYRSLTGKGDAASVTRRSPQNGHHEPLSMAAFAQEDG